MTGSGTDTQQEYEYECECCGADAPYKGSCPECGCEPYEYACGNDGGRP